MGKWFAALILCAALSGCSGAPSSRQQNLTPLPYHAADNVAEIVGKSFVNVPAWTLEGALFVAFIGVYLCAMSGFDPTTLRR